MQQAADHLVGEHDFSTFRAVECQAKGHAGKGHDVVAVGGAPWRHDRFYAEARQTPFCIIWRITSSVR